MPLDAVAVTPTAAVMATADTNMSIAATAIATMTTAIADTLIEAAVVFDAVPAN
jgi:hypothetical protein